MLEVSWDNLSDNVVDNKSIGVVIDRGCTQKWAILYDDISS
jgi:hypothetical protein